MAQLKAAMDRAGGGVPAPIVKGEPETPASTKTVSAAAPVPVTSISIPSLTSLPSLGNIQLPVSMSQQLQMLINQQTQLAAQAQQQTTQNEEEDNADEPEQKRRRSDPSATNS